MYWWQRLPSLTPLRGLARFFYVWTHWDTISDELKKRDERLQAVEEWARQILNMERETHEAEKRKIQRKLMEQVEALRAVLGSSTETLDRMLARIETIQQGAMELSDAFGETVRALAVMLYIEESPAVRDRMLALLSPKVREILAEAVGRFRTMEVKEALRPPPLRPPEEESKQ